MLAADLSLDEGSPEVRIGLVIIVVRGQFSAFSVRLSAIH